MIQNDGMFNISGVHALNRYLWDRLESVLGMDKSKTGGLVPIIPVQQQRTFNNYTEPFLVYNWITENQGTDWYFQRDLFVYKIYSEEEAEIRQIINFMRYLFERHDESARSVNEYLEGVVTAAEALPDTTANRLTKDGADRLKRIDFKSIKIAGESGGIDPAETEGGRQVATVVLNTMYTIDYPPNRF